MTNKLAVLISLIVTIFSLIPSSYGQTLELNTNQSLTIPGPGFFPFSTTANDQLMEIFPSNPNITLEFMNFLGGPCVVAPAADFGEIGPKITITGNSTQILDFSGAGPNAGAFGLSLVPQSSQCIFDLFITPPTMSSSSSTSSSSGGIFGEGFINPNGITVYNGFLSDSLANSLSNGPDNPNCGNSPFGINPLTINGTGGNDTINVIFDDLGLMSTNAAPRLASKTFKAESEEFTLTIPEDKGKAEAVYNQKLTNTTDMTKIFATAVFPSFSESSSLTIGPSRVASPRIDVTLKAQVNPALAAVQHAIVSATMPWQLSMGNGFFIVQGGGCVGPFCTIVEQGMVVIDPDGACTPEKLNKRRAGYATFNPSKFFDPFPNSQNVIQVPASNIVDPTHPLVSKVVRDNAYLILQPVPPKAKLIQQLKLSIAQPCTEVVACDKLCSNIGACCQADQNGNALKTCQQFKGGARCSCLP